MFFLPSQREIKNLIKNILGESEKDCLNLRLGKFSCGKICDAAELSCTDKLVRSLKICCENKSKYTKLNSFGYAKITENMSNRTTFEPIQLNKLNCFQTKFN